MAEWNATPEGMIAGFFEWLTIEARELSKYSAARYVCATLPGETAAARADIADTLFTLAMLKKNPPRYAEQGTW